MAMDDKGVADAMYTVMSVAIVMILAIAISGVVLSTTMKQGNEVSSQVTAYGDDSMRKGACVFYYTVDASGSDFASSDPNDIVLKSGLGEKTDQSIAFNRESAPASVPMSNGCVIWSGYVYAPSDGTYTFQLASSDGSWLWIDGSQAIDNHGQHSLQAAQAGIQLTKGYHTVKVRYFYNSIRTASCALSWDSGRAGEPMEIVGPLYR